MAHRSLMADIGQIDYALRSVRAAESPSMMSRRHHGISAYAAAGAACHAKREISVDDGGLRRCLVVQLNHRPKSLRPSCRAITVAVSSAATLQHHSWRDSRAIDTLSRHIASLISNEAQESQLYYSPPYASWRRRAALSSRRWPPHDGARRPTAFIDGPSRG